MLSTSPLLTITGLASIGILKPAQATQVLENPSGNDPKVFQNINSGVGPDFSAILFVAGLILALGSTVSVVYKALNIDKPDSRTADYEQIKAENKPEAIPDSTKSSNKQIAPSVYVEQAYTSFQQGDAQTALTEFNNAITVHPHDAYLYSERANFRRRKLGDRQGALDDYTQAINLHPDNALFYLWRSQLYNEIGDRLKAMADYNTATRLAPEDTMFHSFQTSGNSGKR